MDNFEDRLLKVIQDNSPEVAAQYILDIITEDVLFYVSDNYYHNDGEFFNDESGEYETKQNILFKFLTKTK